VDITRLQRKTATQEYLVKDVDQEMWTADFRYSWRKMEAAAEENWSGVEWSVDYGSLGVTRQKSLSPL